MALTPHSQSLQPPEPSLWRAFLHYLLGSFNGIQVFLYPSLLVYWIKGDSLVGAAYDLMGTGLHLMPLTVFFLLLLFVLFMILKFHLMDYHKLPFGSSDIARHVIKIHRILVPAILAYTVFFALSIFIKYFYGIQISTGHLATMATRVLASAWIVYAFVKNAWIHPWQKLGHSLQSSQKRALVYPRLHPFKFLAFNLYLVFAIIILAKLYTSIMEVIYHPLFSFIGYLTGFLPRFELLPVASTLPLLTNIVLLAFAFLLSNFFFIPLVWLAKHACQIMHPIRIQKSKPTLQERSDNAQA
ncbi:MAG: hypothetical protein GX294_06000 [Candidatus Cloacimonetes bacterium]|nr:hypothetical protein [Candidatus Cloacimonadota bacterium]